MVGSGLFDETGKRRTEIEPVSSPVNPVTPFDEQQRIKPNTEADGFKYNKKDIEDLYNKEYGAVDWGVKKRHASNIAQAHDADAPIYFDTKINPNKSFNIPNFIELMHRLGTFENRTKGRFVNSYNNTASGFYQLSYKYFAPEELIEKNNKEHNLDLKAEKFREMKGVHRAKTEEEFYDWHYQGKMAMNIMKGYLELYKGNVVQAIVAYNAGPSRANVLGPNNDWEALNEEVFKNRVSPEKIKEGERIMRDALSLVNKILNDSPYTSVTLGEGYGKMDANVSKKYRSFLESEKAGTAKTSDIALPEPKPKKVGGFV